MQFLELFFSCYCKIKVQDLCSVRIHVGDRLDILYNVHIDESALKTLNVSGHFKLFLALFVCFVGLVIGLVIASALLRLAERGSAILLVQELLDAHRGQHFLLPNGAPDST